MKRGISIAVLCYAAMLLSPVGLQAADPPKAAGAKAAIQKACQLLLKNQENYESDSPVGRLPDDGLGKWQDGERARLDKLREASRGKAREWPYEGVHRVRRVIPAGYRVGGSAIVCEALLEAPGFDKERKAAIHRSVEFMLEMIEKDPGLASHPQAGYDVRGWGQAYALKLFLRLLEKDTFKGDTVAPKMKAAIPDLISRLQVGQVKGGGWNYAGRGVSPFMTAPTLMALFHAREAGFKVDAQMVNDALDALARARDERVAYAYSGAIGKRNVAMAGACARSAAAELALYRAGRSSIDGLRKAIDGFFVEANWQELLKRKSQQGTHVGPYNIAPYYFFYGHTFAALAVEQLPKKERAKYRKKMRELLWRTIESDGGWNDRIFPRTESYSTAMSVLALIAKDLPAVKTWERATVY